jgi:WD40 repeat protein
VTAPEPGGQPAGHVDAKNAQGVQVGDGNVQIINVVGTGLGRSVQDGEPVFAVPPPRQGDIPRPGLTGQLLAHLLAAERAGVVGMTTGLAGAGGFGKTTLARMLVHDPATLAEYPDGIVWVTVGQELTGVDLAERINDVCATVTGRKPLHTDPLLAGADLGAGLGGRRMLLVVDDVWSKGQMEPFLAGGPNTVRLVTTRQRSVLPAGAARVDVDAMDADEATQLLTAGMDPVPRPLVDELLAATGKWPVLLGLVNGAARVDVAHGARPDHVLADVRDQLRADGITVLDIADPDHRHLAVSATLEVSLARLTPDEQDRYTELAIFGGDVDIPLSVLARYWRHTNGWTGGQTRTLCRHLADVSLLATYRLDQPPRVRLHDVVRAYLRHLAADRLPALHAALLDAHRDLATTDSPALDGPATAWCRLPAGEVYLWEHVPTHLHAAGLHEELNATVAGPGWLVGKLEHVGPAGLESDLTLSANSTCQALATAVRQSAHLLGSLDPPGSLTTTLASRLPAGGPAAAVATALEATVTGPHLRPLAPPPDLPHAALTRVLTGHTRGVGALAAAPDGTWLASASRDHAVRVWDVDTGAARHTLIGHAGTVTAVAVARDGSWLASAAIDGTLRIWNPTTGEVAHVLTGHTGEVRVLAVHPEASWLASAGADGTVRVWNPVTGAALHTLTGHEGPVMALAVDPHGAWLASAGNDAMVRVWDAATGAIRHALAGHPGPVEALAVDPHGAWLASAGNDAMVRVWDAATGAIWHILAGHVNWVEVLAVAPDGAWLASAGNDDMVRVWDPTTGAARHTLTGHEGPVVALGVASDGTWLAAASHDHTVRIWNLDTGAIRHTLTGHTDEVLALAVGQDGSWLASGGGDPTVRVWNPAIGTTRRILANHNHQVWALAAAPDRSWLASAGRDGMVRVWDPDTAATLRTLTGHTAPVHALAAAPDGSWLASAGVDGTVRVWEVATGTTRHRLTGHRGAIVALMIARDGTWLASAGMDGRLRVWEAGTGTRRHTIGGHTSSVASLAAAPDGSWLASAGDDGTVRLWDVTTGAARHTLIGHTGQVRTLAAGPDGSWLASAGADGTVRLWDVATGTSMQCLTGHTDWVEVLAVGPDGSWLASASHDHAVRVWDVDTGTTRHILIGHTGQVWALAVQPSGSWLASAGYDGTARVWDPVTGEALPTIRVDGALDVLAWVGQLVVAGGAGGCHFWEFVAQPYQPAGSPLAGGGSPRSRHDLDYEGR